MKKYITIIMISIIFLTGCGKSKDVDESVLDNKKTTLKAENKKTTTTKKTTKKTTSTTTKSVTTKQATTQATKQATTVPTTKATTTTVASTTAPTTTTTTTTTASVSSSSSSEASVYNAMMSLQSKYPTGTPWDNSNSYAWRGGIYTVGYGCAGFAFMLSDAAFGSKAARKTTDLNNIRVGDIIRLYGDTHSVIVLKVNSDSYTVAEGNLNSAVYWGRTVSKSEVVSTGTYVLTRW